MHEIFSILPARPELVAAAGSSSGERGLPACRFRLLAETDFLLPFALDEFTIPVRSKTRRGEFGLWRLAKTDFLGLGSARYRVSRLYRASSHQMSITRTSAGNSPSPLIAVGSSPD